jgi:hypothetical protein
METWPFRRVFRVVRFRYVARGAVAEVPQHRRNPGPARALRITPQGWWILCTATLCALPLTIWEFKNQGFSPHYQGARVSSAAKGPRRHVAVAGPAGGRGGAPTRRAPAGKAPLAPLPPTRPPHHARPRAAWFVAGIFVIMTIPIAVYEVRAGEEGLGAGRQRGQ